MSAGFTDVHASDVTGSQNSIVPAMLQNTSKRSLSMLVRVQPARLSCSGRNGESKYVIHRPQPSSHMSEISDLLIIFAEALARSGEDDKTAETLLERLADSPATTGDTDAILNYIKSKVFLARVQRRRGKPGAAKKQYASYHALHEHAPTSQLFPGKSSSSSGSRRIRICYLTPSCGISSCQ